MAELSTLGAVIKAAYEAESNTNALTDSEKAILAEISLSGSEFADSMISESSVTQHQAALSIATSQLTGTVALTGLANQAQATLVGRAAGAGTGAPTALVEAQILALIPEVASAAPGLAPAHGGVGATYYLDASNNWSIPAGGWTDAASAPASAPASARTFYHDTATDTFYIAKGTSSAADWVQVETELTGELISDLTTTEAIVPGDYLTFGNTSDSGASYARTVANVISDLSLSVTTATETLTNKSLTDPKITLSENAQTGTSYTLVLSDASKPVFMTNGSANTLTIPTNASVAFPVGAAIVVWQGGTGTTTISGDTGVTLNGVSAGSGDISGQYKAVALIKRATDTWFAGGAIGTVS